MKRVFVDIAAMQETEYTGIPQVAAQLSTQLLGDSTVEPGFFYNRHEVSVPIVEKLLVSRDGRLLRWASERYCMRPIAHCPPGDEAYGLHTNMKFARRLFPIEGQIVHDLTTVVTPDYHTPETNAYHQEKFFGDLMSNDVTFCVSESTAADLRTFYADMPGSIVVAHLGVDWGHVDVAHQQFAAAPERYIFILGTLEPRKNIADVLDMLAAQPSIARRYRFVFGGRVGWGDAFESQVEARGLGALLAAGRILRTGFVSESTKYLLIKNAALVIYPSLYEGFGLPVAEAISLDVPVVTTPSSSLPEVGRDLAFYFTPGDQQSLGRAVTAALAIDQTDPDRVAARTDWLGHFSWQRCYAGIRDALLAARPIGTAG